MKMMRKVSLLIFVVLILMDKPLLMAKNTYKIEENLKLKTP